MPRSVTSATEPKWLTVWRVHVRAKHMPNRHGRNSAHRAFDRSNASDRDCRDSRVGFTGHLLLPDSRMVIVAISEIRLAKLQEHGRPTVSRASREEEGSGGAGRTRGAS
jgi:hypothetical protein